MAASSLLTNGIFVVILGGLRITIQLQPTDICFIGYSKLAESALVFKVGQQKLPGKLRGPLPQNQ